MFSNPAIFVLVGVGGFYLPDRLLNDLRKARERQILRALPGAVDVLSLSVEAGLEFLIALQRLVERGSTGPLRDELATILNDIRLGTSRSDALKAFSSRVEIPEVSSFVSVLVQADELGASIGPVLRQQGERMRVERFQRAEREGAKVSQKILFPLVLFIFPAVLIVIIGPVVLQFIYGR
jgi:tight adherence protein C